MEPQHTQDTESDRSTEILTIARPTPRTLLVSLIAVIGLLVLLDALPIGAGRETGERIAINSPFSVAAWWSSFQLLFLGTLLALLAVRDSRAGRRATTVTLGIGAAVAVFWSIDKIADFKETIIGTLRSGETLPSLGGGPSILMVVGAVLTIALIAAVTPGVVALFRADPVTVPAVVIGGAMNLLGAAAVGAIIVTDSPLRVAVEEAVEFLGVAIMVWAVYRMFGSTEIRVTER